jgi:hypothetical protein
VSFDEGFCAVAEFEKASVEVTTKLRILNPVLFVVLILVSPFMMNVVKHRGFLADTHGSQASLALITAFLLFFGIQPLDATMK